MPTPSLPLVISFGPRLTIRPALPDAAATTVGSFVGGMHDRHVLIEAAVHHGIQVDLEPLGAYRLLGRPLRELTGEVVALTAAFGPDADRLVDDLASTPGWPDRFHRLDRFLVGRAMAGRSPAPEVARAWSAIVASRGRVGVRALATQVGWSQRHLTDRFGAALGLSPKRMARLVRFDHAGTLLSMSPRVLRFLQDPGPVPAYRRVPTRPGASAMASPLIPTPCYRDVRRAVDFLVEAFGFERHALYEDDRGAVAHVELVFGGGMLMLATPEEGEYGRMVRAVDDRPTTGFYVVVPDVAAHARRAQAAGAELVIGPRDRDHGGSDYTCRDLEGHLWTFGSYDPWAASPR